ncbi:MAG: hypothetical protein ACREBV_09740, partial [Candidatus Zixiibacteriota bacterium]
PLQLSIGQKVENPKLRYSPKFHFPQQRLDDLPQLLYTGHSRNNLQLAIGNNGTFGTLGQSIPDPFNPGHPIQSCIHPKNSDLVYLWVGAFWIGAVVGRDTVVSTANEDFYELTEFWSLPDSAGKFKYASIDRNSDKFDEDKLAFSEEDIITEYYDTVTNPALVVRDFFDQSSHQPLQIRVDQRSMAWSYSYAEDFILFDYQVTNIGDNSLKNVYMGIYVDGDAWHISKNDPTGWNDDMVGFYRTHPAPDGCGYEDTLNIAWHADSDGDPSDDGSWNGMSVRSVLGMMVVRTPSEDLGYSFNWWITNYGDAARDFGPRKAPALGDPYRNFGARMGTPEGDRNKYYVMRHNEFDYDLLSVALDHTAEGFLAPPIDALDYAYGFDTRYLLSFGPF